jgi:hypothetical protein
MHGFMNVMPHPSSLLNLIIITTYEGPGNMKLSVDFNLSRLQLFIFYINHFYVAFELAGTERSVLELGLKKRVGISGFGS